MLLRAVTFIGGHDGIFCMVTRWLGVEALEHWIQELVSELPSFFIDLHSQLGEKSV